MVTEAGLQNKDHISHKENIYTVTAFHILLVLKFKGIQGGLLLQHL